MNGSEIKHQVGITTFHRLYVGEEGLRVITLSLEYAPDFDPPRFATPEELLRYISSKALEMAATLEQEACNTEDRRKP